MWEVQKVMPVWMAWGHQMVCDAQKISRSLVRIRSNDIKGPFTIMTEVATPPSVRKFKWLTNTLTGAINRIFHLSPRQEKGPVYQHVHRGWDRSNMRWSDTVWPQWIFDSQVPPGTLSRSTRILDWKCRDDASRDSSNIPVNDGAPSTTDIVRRDGSVEVQVGSKV